MERARALPPGLSNPMTWHIVNSGLTSGAGELCHEFQKPGHVQYIPKLEVTPASQVAI